MFSQSTTDIFLSRTIAPFLFSSFFQNNPPEHTRSPSQFNNTNDSSILDYSNEDDSDHVEDELDNTRLIPAFKSSSISFQKRQALEKYFEHHRAGITLDGFLLDRTSLRVIFRIELALVLCLLKIIVTIS